ncbi:hypothetical protein J4G33_04720 [Actinotalea sp. BY-33]|uniref:Uncharacterized protein n=1 Tax=Actinotalea soli TaxID=2819234 RepID=A0A939RSF9_9CELL|nr:hypothetical protein [Actinotalea soli]MBO1751102.1 hypothetical protein [Actinotalea soli]
MTMSRWARVVGASSCAVLALGVTACSTPGSAPSEAERAAQSEGLEPWFSLLSEQPGFEGGGFAEDGESLEFLWSEPLSSEAEEIAAEAERQGSVITHRQLDRSSAEMAEASERLRLALTEQGVIVTSLAPNREHDAISIQGPELSEDPALQELAARLAEDALPAGVALEVEPYVEQVDAAFSTD